MTNTADDNGRGRVAWWRLAPWAGAAVLLSLPAIAMRFTTEVDWDAFDFAVMGAMLFAACGAFELAVRASGSLAYRAGATLAIGAAFLLVWANLAVGYVGDEDNPFNLLFFGVLLLGLLGAVLARFRARGLAIVMLAVAISHLAVAIGGLVAGMDVPLPPTAVFIALWLTSAAMFRRAAQQGGPTL